MASDPGIVTPQTVAAQSDSRAMDIGFGLLFLAASGGFMIWGLDYTNHSQVLIFVLATAIGLFMAFNIGGNDVANSFGTSVGSGTITIKQALAIAAIFEVSGAVIAGGEVTKTIRKGIVDLGGLEIEPMQFVFIMMSALLAAALWLLFATKRGWPVSTTHSIVGGIVGSAIALGTIMGGSELALALVQWDQIGFIAISWVLSPLLGGLVSYLLFSTIKRLILQYNDRMQAQIDEIEEQGRQLGKEHGHSLKKLRDAKVIERNTTDHDGLEAEYFRDLRELRKRKKMLPSHLALQNWVPVAAAFGAVVIAAMLLFKGLKNLDLGLSTTDNFLIMAMVGTAAWAATYFFARTLKGKALDRSTFLLFSWLQVFTACGFAFSHGANDIANAIGPFAAILDVLKTGQIDETAAVPTAAMLSFGIALIVGLWFIGKEVIQTVGTHLTKMHPASGFAAELSAAAVVLLASTLGIPVSSTHILIGAVLGIGIANSQTNWALMRPIGLAWVITLPAAGLLSAGAFVVLRSLL